MGTLLPRDDEDEQLARHGDAPATSRSCLPRPPQRLPPRISRQILGAGAESEELRGDGRRGDSRGAFAVISRSHPEHVVLSVPFPFHVVVSFTERAQQRICPRLFATSSSNPDTGTDKEKNKNKNKK